VCNARSSNIRRLPKQPCSRPRSSLKAWSAGKRLPIRGRRPIDDLCAPRRRSERHDRPLVYAVTAIGDWLLLGEFSAQLLQDRDFSTNWYILVDAARYHRRRFEGHSGTGDLSSAQQPAMPVIGYLGVGSRRQAPACGYIPPGVGRSWLRRGRERGDRIPLGGASRRSIAGSSR